MQLATRLFGVTIEAADGQVPVWDKAVRFFVVKEEGVPKAHFYLDPYSRPEEKRGGAWMDEVAGQSKLVRLAFLIARLYAWCASCWVCTDSCTWLSCCVSSRALGKRSAATDGATSPASGAQRESMLGVSPRDAPSDELWVQQCY